MMKKPERGVVQLHDRYSQLSEFFATLQREPWMSEGVCAETDPEEFFPEQGGSTRMARLVCLACPVTAECLEYAMVHYEAFGQHGIWGATTSRERRKLRRAT